MGSIRIEGVRAGLRPGHGQWNFTLAVAVMVVFGSISMAWTQAPQLVSVDPPDGAAGVPRTTGMVFVFDQPMDTIVDVVPSYPPFLLGNFELSVDFGTVLFSWEWSEDGRTLTGTHIFGELPPGTLITWRLNPGAGGEDPLVNESGVPVATTEGSFTTAGQSTGGGGDDEDCDGLPDVWGTYSVIKGASYEQTSAADPVEAEESPYLFGASVSASDSGESLTGGSVTIPGAGEQELDAAPFTGDLYVFSVLPTEAIWNSVFPAGTYTLRFTQDGQGERVIAMEMPADTVPKPKIENFTEAQSIDATQDFTLRWNEFTDRGANAYISITVEDDTLGFETVFEAPNYCVPLELPASATSVVIPANTLSPDRIYQGTIFFGKYGYVSTNAIPEMAGSAGIGKTTTFTLNTATGGTGSPIAATLSDLQLLPNGDLQITLSGTAGHAYQVERTGSLDEPVWVPLGSVTMGATGQDVFVDTIALNLSPWFYRAVAD